MFLATLIILIVFATIAWLFIKSVRQDYPRDEVTEKIEPGLVPPGPIPDKPDSAEPLNEEEEMDTQEKQKITPEEVDNLLKKMDEEEGEEEIPI